MSASYVLGFNTHHDSYRVRYPVGMFPLESFRLVMPAPHLRVASHGDSDVDVDAARHSLSVAWNSYRRSTIRHYAEGLEFGRVCYEWRTTYKAQGSRTGKGFDHLLGTIGIPKTTAYRWLRRYELRHGLRATRNEVRRAQHDEVDTYGAKRPTSIHFFLDSQRKRQFDEDITILGGPEKVAELFLEFVARSAFERRAANGVPTQKALSAVDYRRTA
jgi:hypothetical protein